MQPTTVFGLRLHAAESAERAAPSDLRRNRGSVHWAIESGLNVISGCVSVLASHEAYTALAMLSDAPRASSRCPAPDQCLGAMLTRAGTYRSDAGLLRIRETARVQQTSFFSAIRKTAYSSVDALFYIHIRVALPPFALQTNRVRVPCGIVRPYSGKSLRLL
jgi:hypothetical protein